MKKIKIILSLIIIGALSNKVNAQCFPDVSKDVIGVYPSTLPNAVEGEAYSETVTMVFPKDTTVSIYKLGLDSVVINAVSNLPAGMTSTCTTPCTYISNGVDNILGCVGFSGTPTETVDDKPISIQYTLWVTAPFLGAQGIPLDTVLELTVVNDNGFEAIDASKVGVFPNPTESTINVNIGTEQNVLVEIYDLKGKLFFSQANVNVALTDLSIANLPSGMYLVKMGNANFQKNISFVKK